MTNRRYMKDINSVVGKSIAEIDAKGEYLIIKIPFGKAMAQDILYDILETTDEVKL